MDKQERKAAVAAYRERKPAFGVYAIICTATGEVWVGTSRTVDTHKNRLWFELGIGSHANGALQAAWRAHGATEFRYEELDRLREDFPDFDRDDELKKRRALWQTRLRAQLL
ncbi:GIY-YIG nuclease family protein [Xanthobacter autotrophicus]|uniref:GIY-YIG nuclease family protein n=1 Tax=Xanthobacter autotrophicus TaxID=280 RepID=UPI001E592207|nr:GIY-YIG nuclease family protein [Xanthobacter autotrophicus]UDQ89837.1 GIY-YIG nuclease family protein [Xanthobacter autotrophicus]